MLHGYELSVDRLGEVVDRLAATREKRRDDVPGLSAERADSIVGGAVAIQTLAEFVRAKHILVSGQGVREGIALGLLKMAIGSPEAVKEASLASLVSRFDGWRREAAAPPAGRRLRAPACARAARSGERGDGDRSRRSCARHRPEPRRGEPPRARGRHPAHTELNGFAHDELALVSAIVRRAGDRHAEVLSLGARPRRTRAAAGRSRRDHPGAGRRNRGQVPARRRIAVECKIGRNVTLSVPLLPSWLAKDLDKRFERAFGRALIVRH